MGSRPDKAAWAAGLPPLALCSTTALANRIWCCNKVGVRNSAAGRLVVPGGACFVSYLRSVIDESNQEGRGRELRHALPRPSACAHALPCVLHNGVLHGGLHNGVLHGGASLPSCCSSPASRRFPRGLSLIPTGRTQASKKQGVCWPCRGHAAL